MESLNQEILILYDINNEIEYNNIINKINSFYMKNRDFHLLIETKHVEKIKFNYLYKFGNYLNNLKKKSPQYLKGTIIYVYDDNIFNLLYTLFTYVSSPVAKVTVIYYNGGYNKNEIKKELDNIKKIKYYYPHKTKNI